MKVTELLDLAATVQHRPNASLAAMELATDVVDLLGESDPCGFEPPEVRDVAGEIKLFPPATWCAWVTPDDARAMARMLLRAADEAEGG